MSLPKLIRVQQVFDKTRLEDAAEAVAAGLTRMGIAKKIRPGDRIAITAGSRGIQNLVKMTRAAVDTVKALGGRPFIVPAMGSHAGGTEDGQRRLLAHPRAAVLPIKRLTPQAVCRVMSWACSVRMTAQCITWMRQPENSAGESPAMRPSRRPW